MSNGHMGKRFREVIGPKPPSCTFSVYGTAEEYNLDGVMGVELFDQIRGFMGSVVFLAPFEKPVYARTVRLRFGDEWAGIV